MMCGDDAGILRSGCASAHPGCRNIKSGGRTVRSAGRTGYIIGDSYLSPYKQQLCFFFSGKIDNTSGKTNEISKNVFKF